jgi:hypothetical protein
MTQQIFPPKLQGSLVQLTFDFSSLLPSGQTLSTPTTTAAVYSGVDPTPSSIISGADAVSGTSVTQNITDGVAGCTYLLTCSCTTSGSLTLVRQGFLTIIPAAGI